MNVDCRGKTPELSRRRDDNLPSNPPTPTTDRWLSLEQVLGPAQGWVCVSVRAAEQWIILFFFTLTLIPGKRVPFAPSQRRSIKGSVRDDLRSIPAPSSSSHHEGVLPRLRQVP